MPSLLKISALFSILAAGAASAQTRVLPAADKPLQATFADVYRVGGSDVDDWAEFRLIKDVTFDAAGNLYILDSRGSQITVVDARGRLVKKLGRRGDGPGEFSAPTQFTVFGDGSVAVLDGLKDHLSVFGPDGKFIKNVKPDFPDAKPGIIHPASKDRLFFQAGLFIMNGVVSIDGPNLGQPADKLPVGMIDLNANKSTTLDRVWLAQYPKPPTPRSMHGLSARAFSAAWNGKLAVADTVAYRITVIGEDKAKQVITRGITPRKATSQDREFARKQQRDRLIAPDGSSKIAGASMDGSAPGRANRQAVERALADMTFAEYVQVIVGMETDPEGRLYVARNGNDLSKPGPIDVIAKDGTYMGTIAGAKLPNAFGPNGMVAYIEADQYDAPMVVVKRIQLQ